MTELGRESSRDALGPCGTLVYEFQGNRHGQSAKVIFVPDGAQCENCDVALTPSDACETEDEVLLCSKCYEDCAEIIAEEGETEEG